MYADMKKWADEGVLSHMGHLGMCSPKGDGF